MLVRDADDGDFVNRHSGCRSHGAGVLTAEVSGKG